MKILIAGGIGGISSAFVRQYIADAELTVINVAKLRCAGNLQCLAGVRNNPRIHFEQGDICDSISLGRVYWQHQPDAVIQLASESHVLRSIDGPTLFEAN
jgi:dTDP-glucose 4,6-dehydratase